MKHDVACTCGNILSVSEGTAGSSVPCRCGLLVSVPTLSRLRVRSIASALPPFERNDSLSDERIPEPNSRELVIPPMQVRLRTEDENHREATAGVMLALTPEAIWIQETWRLRSISLREIGIDWRRAGKEVEMNLVRAAVPERLTLAFPSEGDATRFSEEILFRQQHLPSEAPPDDPKPAEGVALVRRCPEIERETLGKVQFNSPNQWTADRGLQLLAGVNGADAVIEYHRTKSTDESGGIHVSGMAGRIATAEGRNRIRQTWYDEEAIAIGNRMLRLLGYQSALIFAGYAFCAGTSGIEAPTGETRSEAMRSAALGLGILYFWPVVVYAFLRTLRRPQILVAFSITLLAATTGRGLALMLGQAAAVMATGAQLVQRKNWVFVDPVEWALIFCGAAASFLGWNLAQSSRRMLPVARIGATIARKALSRGLLVLTGVYAIGLAGFLGNARYESSLHVLHPGADPLREGEALLAYNEGSKQVDKSDFAAAEQSFQRSLRIWDELTARPSHPTAYRAYKARTLYNLGWIRHRQGHIDDELERYYSQAVTVADSIADRSQMDAAFEQCIDDARRILNELSDIAAFKKLDERDRVANAKYEDALIKAEKGDVAAAVSFREALDIWEEILPKATSDEYRTFAIAHIASAYVGLGEIQQHIGKGNEAEASYQKSIEYRKKAVALDPKRPLPKHNLDVARRKLEGLHEAEFHEEISKLVRAERYSDAIDACQRSIEVEENRIRSVEDGDAATLRLASRLNRLAWILAHCPDRRYRDAKEANKRARRATDLQPTVVDFWFTLAAVQYRNGEWKESLESLEQVKARQNQFAASDWFFSAMAMHQLKRKEEARAALRKGVEWIAEMKRRGQDNPLIRFQFETLRPEIEELQREAEMLIEEKGPAKEGLG